jgi:lipopolysaccharide biosynthesis regulator YciM
MKTLAHKFLPLCLLMSLASGPAMAISDTYRELSLRLQGQAATALQADDAKRADELVNIALTADPGNAQAFILKGRVTHALGDTMEALRLVTAGLEIEPTDLKGRILQVRYAVDLGDIETAERAMLQYRAVCRSSCDAADQLQNLVNEKRADVATRKRVR